MASGSPGEVRGVRVIWEPIKVQQASDGRDRWRVATMWEAILVDCARGDATVPVTSQEVRPQMIPSRPFLN